MSGSSEEIWVVTAADAPGEKDDAEALPGSTHRGGSKGSRATAQAVKKAFDAATLGGELSKFVSSMGKVLDKVDVNLPHFELSEITVEVEVSASGHVHWVVGGAHAEAGATTSLTFSRKKK